MGTTMLNFHSGDNCPLEREVEQTQESCLPPRECYLEDVIRETVWINSGLSASGETMAELSE